MDYKIITDEAGFLAEKENWNAICARMEDKTPFQSWQWNYYWWKYNEPADSLFIIKAFEGKQVFGYAPIVVKKKTAQFIGDRHFDYGMFVCAERKREIFDLFIKVLLEKQGKKRISLCCIPAICDQFSLFKESALASKKIAFREQVSTANVHLTEYDGFEGYLQAISASIRKKAIKPCIKAGISFQLEDFSEEVWQAVGEIFADRQEQRTAVGDLEWAKPIVRDLQAEGILKIATLWYEGERCAYLIYFENSEKYYIWLTAFKQTGSYRLGHFVRYHLIQEAYQNSKHTVDMMRGAYEYKKHWDCNVAYNYEYKVFGSAIGRNVYLLKMAIKMKIRKTVYASTGLTALYKKMTVKVSGKK